MDKFELYRHVATALEVARCRPFRDLTEQVDQPPRTAEIPSTQGVVTIEFSAHWHSVESRAIQLQTVASGPSPWKLERLEESVVVREVDGDNAT